MCFENSGCFLVLFWKASLSEEVAGHSIGFCRCCRRLRSCRCDAVILQWWCRKFRPRDGNDRTHCSMEFHVLMLYYTSGRRRYPSCRDWSPRWSYGSETPVHQISRGLLLLPSPLRSLWPSLSSGYSWVFHIQINIKFRTAWRWFDHGCVRTGFWRIEVCLRSAFDVRFQDSRASWACRVSAQLGPDGCVHADHACVHDRHGGDDGAHVVHHALTVFLSTLQRAPPTPLCWIFSESTQKSSLLECASSSKSHFAIDAAHLFMISACSTDDRTSDATEV